MDHNENFDDDLEMIRQKRLMEMQRTIERKCAISGQGVTEINELGLDDFVAANRYAVIDFWAEWCGPCKKIAPAMEELAAEFCGEVAFAKCNTDENQPVAMRFQISAIPTLILFSGGQMADRLTGAYPKDNIRKRIKSTFRI
jgi:thioredoxin 1